MLELEQEELQETNQSPEPKRKPKSEEITTSIKVTKRCRDVINKVRGETTILDFMEEVADSIELMLSGSPIIISDGKLFTDLAQARGAAIMASVRDSQPVQMPSFAIVIAQDKGI